MTAGTTKRLLLLMAPLCLCLGLGACTPFAGAVSDAWPTWAGGEPKDVPPRPGAPGYEEFIAHQQRQDVAPNAAPNGTPNAAAAPGTAAVVAPAGAAPGAPGTTAAAVPVTAPAGTTVTVPPPASRYTPPPPQAPLPPAYARPDDRSATQGGLY